MGRGIARGPGRDGPPARPASLGLLQPVQALLAARCPRRLLPGPVPALRTARLLAAGGRPGASGPPRPAAALRCPFRPLVSSCTARRHVHPGAWGPAEARRGAQAPHLAFLPGQRGCETGLPCLPIPVLPHLGEPRGPRSPGRELERRAGSQDPWCLALASVVPGSSCTGSTGFGFL